MTDAALHTEDDGAQIMLARHAVNTAVNDLVSKGHPQSVVAVELIAQSMLIMG